MADQSDKCWYCGKKQRLASFLFGTALLMMAVGFVAGVGECARRREDIRLLRQEHKQELHVVEKQLEAVTKACRGREEH